MCATLATTHTLQKYLQIYLCVWEGFKKILYSPSVGAGAGVQGRSLESGHHPKDYSGLAWTPGMHYCHRKGYCAGSLSSRKESILVQGVLYVLPARKCVFGSVLFIYTSITAGYVYEKETYSNPEEGSFSTQPITSTKMCVCLLVAHLQKGGGCVVLIVFSNGKQVSPPLCLLVHFPTD